MRRIELEQIEILGFDPVHLDFIGRGGRENAPRAQRHRQPQSGRTHTLPPRLRRTAVLANHLVESLRAGVAKQKEKPPARGASGFLRLGFVNPFEGVRQHFLA